MIHFSLVCLFRIWLVFFPGIFLLLQPVTAQRARERVYNIIRQGDLRGTLHLSEYTEGETCRIKIESRINTRFLFNITVNTIEEAVYQEGLLIFSSFYQKINNKEKQAWQMNWNKGSYQISGNRNDKQAPKTPVRYSILSLYCQEPVNIREVFSDHFQRFLPVISVGTGRYRVDLPDGNRNYYIYQQGTLVRVEVDQPFYAVQFILKS